MDEITVIIDGQTATDGQIRELYKLYEENGHKIPRGKKIRHYSFDYSKKLADQNHV